MSLYLWKFDVFAEGPKTKFSSGKESKASKCCHYAGVVAADPKHSLAEISVCEGEIGGLVQFKGHQYTLGKFGTKKGSEVFYRHDQLNFTPHFNKDSAKYLPDSQMLWENRKDGEGEGEEKGGKGKGGKGKGGKGKDGDGEEKDYDGEDKADKGGKGKDGEGEKDDSGDKSGKGGKGKGGKGKGGRGRKLQSEDAPCVKVFVEVESEVFDSKGDETQSWMEEVMAQVAVVYANAGQTLQVSEFYIWNTVDPFEGTTGEKLDGFMDQWTARIEDGTDFNGDIAHLVGFTGGGGVAYVDVLCNPWYGYGMSAVDSTYSEVPLFSWTVMVISHEIGHQYGAGHTHDCEWSETGYGSQAIDCCGPNAGYAGIGCGSSTCSLDVEPDFGTVMSYCHITSTGIDLGEGFHPWVALRFDDRVNAASCLGTCSVCPTFYADADGDGLGDANTSENTCDG